MSLMPNQLADIVCPKCGENNWVIARYCRNCGTKLPYDPVSGIPTFVTVSGKVTVGRGMKPYELSFFNTGNGRLWDTVSIHNGQYIVKLRNLTNYAVVGHYRRIFFRGSRLVGNLRIQISTNALSANWTL